MTVKGLVKAEWAPDGRTVVCFSEWGVSLACCFGPHSELSQLRVSMWSLTTGSATYIQFPTHIDRGGVSYLPLARLIADITAGYAFRSDGRYFVLAERHKSKDTIGVYEASSAYKLVRVSLIWSKM